MIVEGRSFAEETTGYNLVQIFPYLAANLDAIKELRRYEWDIGKPSTFAMGSGKRTLTRDGTLGRRIASIPLHIYLEGEAVHGKGFWQDRRAVYSWLRAHPEWSFIYGE